MKPSVRVRAALISTCAALALAGCAESGPAFAVFDTKPGPADAVSVELPDYAWDTADQATARFAGEHDGTSLWLTRGKNEIDVCLVAYKNNDIWSVSCAGGSMLRVGGLVGSFTVLPDGAPAPEGQTQVSDNVYAPGAG